MVTTCLFIYTRAELENKPKWAKHRKQTEDVLTGHLTDLFMLMMLVGAKRISHKEIEKIMCPKKLS